MTETPDLLLARIEAYLTAQGMAPTAFGKSAAGDPRLVFEMRAGRELRRATAERVNRFLEQSIPSASEAA